MSKKNIQMQVLGESGYDEICPIPAEHALSHATGGSDPIKPSDIGALDKHIYDSQNRNTDIFTYVDEHATNIPITSTPSKDDTIWIDPNEDGDDSWYTKAETDGLLGSKADLDSNGKVLSTQLPDMDYIPNSAKGSVNGVATLGSDGKVPSTQLPAMNYAAKTHASQHASGGSDPITPASIGAATADHTHSNYAASSHNHAASEITSGTLGVARGGTGKSSVTSGNFLVGNGTSALTEKTPAQVLSAIGAAASSHNHSATNITSGTLGVARGGTGKSSVTSGNFLVGNGTSALTEKTPAEVLSAIGAAASSHNHSAANITSGTLAVTRGGTGVTSLDALKSALGVSGSVKITYGELTDAYNRTISCGFFPVLVIVSDDESWSIAGCAIRGMSRANIANLAGGANVYRCDITWNDTSVIIGSYAKHYCIIGY